MKAAESIAEGAHEQLIAMVARELRHPLVPIRQAAALLSREAPDAASVRRAAEIIERQARDLNRLIGDLVDVSNMRLGALPLHRVRASLGELIERATAHSAPAASERGHTLSVNVARQPIYLSMDLLRIGQAVQNVIGNASKFMVGRGHIDVSLRREGERALINVSDTGIGIPADQLESIFGLFEQAAQGWRAAAGLGLGLYLARYFIEAHRGTLTAASAGRGSVFTICLPCEPFRRHSRDSIAAEPAGDPSPA